MYHSLRADKVGRIICHLCEITEKFSERTFVIIFVGKDRKFLQILRCHFSLSCAIGIGFMNPFSVDFSFINLNYPDYEKETLEMLMLPELCGSPSLKIPLHYWNSIEKRRMGSLFAILRKRSKLIQEIIRKNEQEKRRFNPLCLFLNSLLQHHQVREHNGGYRF